MSNLFWLITLVLLLTVAGTLALGLTAKYYYWGSRGTPPPKKKADRKDVAETRTK